MEAVQIILKDFSDGYSDPDTASSMMRRRLEANGLDIFEPTQEGVYEMIELFHREEAGHLGHKEADRKKRTRIALVRTASTH